MRYIEQYWYFMIHITWMMNSDTGKYIYMWYMYSVQKLLATSPMTTEVIQIFYSNDYATHYWVNKSTYLHDHSKTHTCNKFTLYKLFSFYYHEMWYSSVLICFKIMFTNKQHFSNRIEKFHKLYITCMYMYQYFKAHKIPLDS